MDSKRVHMVGSLGGHLELLTAAAPSLEGHRITWVTSEGVRAQALRNEGQRVRALPRLDRGSLRLRSVFSGVWLALRDRPEVVVTSGAGLAVPFSLVSRALGARVVFVETMARVHGGSRTGRLLARVAQTVIVQWPELKAASYPDATVCRPLLLEGVGEKDEGAATRAGTFVTVGSHDVPFTRLLRMVEVAAAEGLLPTPVFVQYGVGERPEGVEGDAWLDPLEFRNRIDGAELVIAHGGAGALATALRSGRKPVVVARSEAAGEHVDDHQSDLVAKLAALGLIVEVDSTRFTVEQIDGARGRPEFEAERHGPRLTDVLSAAVAAAD